MSFGLETDARGMRIYKPDGWVLHDFIADNSHVAIIRGPIGSGTSSASCQRIWRHACEQFKQSDGIRRSRWLIVRNTYAQLTDTTQKTWLDWFPEHIYGELARSRPARHWITAGDVELEVVFLALDEQEDIRHLKSREVTGIWFNELEYTSKEIFDEAESRTGRWPAIKDGGSRWHGVIADMNAPSEDHWVPQMAQEVPFPDDMPEEEKQRLVWPGTWKYFVQPAALVEILGPDGKSVVDYKVNAAAENTRWLQPGFYEEKWRGKPKSWIDSRLMNRITLFVDGDPVWKSFALETHVAAHNLTPVRGYEVLVALDFGRRPAALFIQEVNGRILVQHELREYNAGATVFAPKVKAFLAKHYPGFRVRLVGDPKGRDKTQADEQTAYDVFAANGMNVRPAPVPNNHIQTRLMAVEHALNSLVMGSPRLLISPNCTTLKTGMAGRYHIKKDANGDPQPVKDKYSDIADCLQYGCLELGEGKLMIGDAVNPMPKRANVYKKRTDLRRVK